jgi:exopolyphosphatase/guanosine-5'-triphosphate,3'-diphosphate pyrophosphatase
MRIATIDIGTNTVLMLIAEVEDGMPTILRDEHSIARLGEGVDKTRRISDVAYSRFAEIMNRYSALLKEYSVDRVAAFATSAMRDAENRAEIIERVKTEFAVDIEILSGDEEAKWSFEGAVFGITAIPGDVATIDIGGGSTEISFGSIERNGGVWSSGKSIDIGAVRIKERFLSAQPQVDEARAYIRQQLSQLVLPEANPHALIAVAGTPTSLAAMKYKLVTFDAKRVDGAVIRKFEIEALTEEILSIDAEELVKRYPAVSPSRADILPAGALILEEALLALGLDSIRVSTQGVRYGILLRELRRIQ